MSSLSPELRQIRSEQRYATARWRLSWRKKAVFAAVTALAFLVGLEVVLAAAGILPLADAHDPFLDFEPGVPLFVRDGQSFVTNPVKLTYFNRQSFSATKGDNSFRIFCLGGSTTYGRPYRDEFSYVGILRDILPELDASRQWEVINCGGISYSSYRLAALMDEIAQYQPDLIVFYEGHNEFLEHRTYSEIRNRWAATNFCLRLVGRLRIATVIHSAIWRHRESPEKTQMPAEVDVILDHSAGPESYHRNVELRKNVLNHFQVSVNRICALSNRSGAGVILIQPASNLRDFSPFKSEHVALKLTPLVEFDRHYAAGRKSLESGDAAGALQHLSAALEIDPAFADACFLAGKSALASGDRPLALRHFVQAKDEDVCPLRALSEIGPILDSIGRAQGAPVIDFPKLVADGTEQRLGHRIPGNESFVDHLHPTLDVHFDLAEAICRTMAEERLLASAGSVSAMRSRLLSVRTSQLTAKVRADALCVLAQELTWAGKVLEARLPARQAAELAPADAWILCQYGRVLERSGQKTEALRIFRQAIQADKTHSLPLFRCGSLLARMGKTAEALVLLEQAVELTPVDAPLAFQANVRVAYGDCLLESGRPNAAREVYLAALRINEGSTEAMQRLAKLPDREMSPTIWPERH